ncbi:MAG: amylo-alpha-1,6-glucosidase, partial [Bacillota bacterium]
DKTLTVEEEFKEERKLAAYVNWESLVNPEGILKRKAMYMSKNHMTNVWSWDHCFNAMALIENNPQIGWDQYVLMFDHQRDNGVLPDRVNDKEYYWNFVKPPIHGWVLKWMMNRSDFITETRLKEVYEPLSRWTDWWFKYRDTDGDGIPEYHHGNDSGWDNSTVFHKGAPVESPDLSAFLVIQMEVLSEIADILGKGEEAAEWEVRSEKLLANMLDHCWTGEEFIAPYPKTHEYFDKGDSLILYIPVILGKRLPESIKNKLIDDLKEEGRFLTENGLATESINSSFYESNGYWRGPIWAPSTMIMIEGIEAAGEKEFAMDLAYRFCQMIKKGGMAENFDAVTGEGLRDRAYTWTSSVFLMLANKVLLKKRD